MAAGVGNQRLYLIPSRRLAAARQADHLFQAMLDRGAGGFSDTAFLRLILGRS